MDINEFAKGLNDPRIKEAVMRLGNSPKGREFLNGLTQADKNELIRKIGKLNSNGITSEMLLRQLNNNPNILNQLNSMLNKKR